MGSDVTLTFNGDQFLNAFNKMSESMLTFEKKLSNTDTQVKKKTGDISSSMIAKGMMMANVGMMLAKKAFDFVKNGIPEIGKTFSIASDIISRNLLWPLRKELIPILQSILNWVRDHRVMFVRLGQIIANVFRGVVAVIKGAFEIISSVVKKIVAGLEKIFGKSKNTIEGTLNLIVFKITTLVLFLQAILEPVLEFLITGFLNAVKYVKNFCDGFSEGLGDISGPLSDVRDMFKSLLDMLTYSEGTVNSIAKAFKIFGYILGSTVGPALTMVAQALDFIKTSILLIIDSLKVVGNAFKGLFTGDFSALKANIKSIGQSLTDYQGRKLGRDKSLYDKSIQANAGIKNIYDYGYSSPEAMAKAKAGMKNIYETGSSILPAASVKGAGKGGVTNTNSNNKTYQVTNHITVEKDMSVDEAKNIVAEATKKVMKDEKREYGDQFWP